MMVLEITHNTTVYSQLGLRGNVLGWSLAESLSPRSSAGYHYIRHVGGVDGTPTILFYNILFIRWVSIPPLKKKYPNLIIALNSIFLCAGTLFFSTHNSNKKTNK